MRVLGLTICLFCAGGGAWVGALADGEHRVVAMAALAGLAPLLSDAARAEITGAVAKARVKKKN